ncbi:MAG TPA: hypothetical protein VIY53_11645 [Acidobacteriaceae bacterium]
MTARQAGAPPSAGAGDPFAAPPGTYPPGAYPPGYPPPPGAPSPGLATLLGFIPGVGAMYNGQYIKAIVHVLVFVVLVGMVDRFWFFGLLIGFWVLYQVFDAHQTAKARRDGLPLPDPFGLNELGNRIGGHTPPMPPPVPPRAGTPPPPPPPGGGGPAMGAVPGAPANPADWAEHVGRQAGAWGDQVGRQAEVWGQQVGQWGEQLRARIVNETTQAANQPRWGAPPPAGWAAPPPPPAGWAAPGAVPPIPPVPPPQWELERARREPIGAIVLILLGMLFLFNTLGFFSFGWVHHGWPLIIVAVALWLLLRNNPRRFGFPMHMHAKPQDQPLNEAQDQHVETPGGDK